MPSASFAFFFLLAGSPSTLNEELMGLNCPIDRKFQSSEVYKETAGRHSEAVGDFAKQTVSQDSLSARFSQAEIRVPESRRTLLKKKCLK